MILCFASSKVFILSIASGLFFIYDILLGIGKEWNNLTDLEQSSLGEALAGKRNANVLYSVMQNIDQLEDIYQTLHCRPLI